MTSVPPIAAMSLNLCCVAGRLKPSRHRCPRHLV
jgi:hypothetical protein